MARGQMFTTVGKLKKIIENFPDDTVLVKIGPNNDYKDVYLIETTALEFRFSMDDEVLYARDGGENFTPENDRHKRVPILVVVEAYDAELD